MLDRIDIKYFKLAVGLDAIGKESEVDIQARCPICGDSRKNKRTKRLHIYNKGTLTNVNCFNGDCPCQNKTVYSFLRDFFPSLFEQYKREQFSTTMQKVAAGDDVFAQFKKEPEPDKTEILHHDLSPYMDDIMLHPEGLEYLRGRGFEYNEQFGKWYFGTQNLLINEVLYKIHNALVIPLYHNGEMYGFYSRNIHEKTFYTYMHDANLGYKIWNWFGVNHNEPTYIFEGIFDAIASGLKNSISAMGAKIPDERINELKTPVFVLDNDKTGLMNTMRYAKAGHRVYIQPDEYPEKDMNELMLNHPELNIPELIQENVFQGISAITRLGVKHNCANLNLSNL